MMRVFLMRILGNMLHGPSEHRAKLQLLATAQVIVARPSFGPRRRPQGFAALLAMAAMRKPVSKFARGKAKAAPKAKAKGKAKAVAKPKAGLHKKAAASLHVAKKPSAVTGGPDEEVDDGPTAHDRRQFKIALGTKGVHPSILKDWTDTQSLGYGKGKREKINTKIMAWKDPSGTGQL